MNTALCVLTTAGSAPEDVELAKMGHMAAPQGSHYEVGGCRCIFLGGAIVLKYPLNLEKDRRGLFM